MIDDTSIGDKKHKERIIKDCIYGHIKIPYICSLFMDQPEFQRLRRIKQLGNVSRVYPSATHTRFEHSIGVMHLAGKMCLQLGFKEDDSLKHLIQLAGLYHDIGHLPYSHLFDKALKYIDSSKIKGLRTGITKEELELDHELRSVNLFLKVATRLNILTDEEKRIVCSCIHPDKELDNPKYNEYPYIYQIVCSLSTGIDVDKLDYLCRDAYHTGMPSFQADYIILNTCIDEKTQSIVFNKKAYTDIENMFQTRERIHKLVYQHKVSLRYDTMYICMILKVIDDLSITMELDDYELDTFLKKHDRTKYIYKELDQRKNYHNELCNNKNHPIIEIKIPESGSINNVKWICNREKKEH